MSMSVIKSQHSPAGLSFFQVIRFDWYQKSSVINQGSLSTPLHSTRNTPTRRGAPSKRKMSLVKNSAVFLLAVVFAHVANAIPFATQYIDCDPSKPPSADGGMPSSSYVLAPFCERLEGFSRIISCAESKVDIFWNKTDCTGQPDLTRPLNECAKSASGLSYTRYACEDINDPELYRRRGYFAEDGSVTNDCSGSYVFSAFHPLNRCFFQSADAERTRSYRYMKHNETVLDAVLFNSTDCSPETLVETIQYQVITNCDGHGQKLDYVSLKDIKGTLRNSIMSALSGH